MSNLSFVNAGYQEVPFANMGIYVKYGNYGKFQLVSESTYHTHMICPDRELYLSNNTLKTSGNPLINDFDEYLDLNALGENFKKDFLPQYMINYTDYAIDGRMQMRKKRSHGSTIFCDSGGFQIAVGRIGIINPLDLAKFYNENVDLGMALDIPEYDEGDPFTDELVMTLARAQKRNTDYMFKVLNNDVELINIIHGGTYEQKLKYFKYVHDDRIHRLALPSVKIPMSLPRLNMILEICRMAKQLGSYKHMHLLGSFNKGVLLVLAKLAHCNIPEVQGIDFTTDASSALQNSVNLTFNKNLTVWSGLDLFEPPLPSEKSKIEYNDCFGSEDNSRESYMKLFTGDMPNEKYTQTDFHRGMFEGGRGTFNGNALLPCNCPVCRTIKYSYVLRNLRAGYLRNQIFLGHNGSELYRYVAMIDEIASNLSTKEYLDYVIDFQGKDNNDIINCIKFIKKVEEVGLDEARKAYSHLIVDNSRVRNRNSFFDNISKKDDMEDFPFKSKKEFEEHIKKVAKEFLETDFEHYSDKIKISKAMRSSSNLSLKEV